MISAQAMRAFLFANANANANANAATFLCRVLAIA
jgi:hypothetical protein